MINSRASVHANSSNRASEVGAKLIKREDQELLPITSHTEGESGHNKETIAKMYGVTSDNERTNQSMAGNEDIEAVDVTTGGNFRKDRN